MNPESTEQWLEPIVDWIGDFPVSHGERDDLDPAHPLRCLCGHPGEYITCPEAFGEGSILGATISKAEDR